MKDTNKRDKLSIWMLESIKKATENEGLTINARLNNIKWILQQESIPTQSTAIQNQPDENW